MALLGANMDWQEFEIQVRQIASLHWDAPCEPETIGGVKCDGIIRLARDHLIAIEISKSGTLVKLREDLAKFQSIKPGQLANGVYVECIFVSAMDTSSLKETGRQNGVEVLSISEFSLKFTGKRNYEHVRKDVEFGSAVDPVSGRPDTGQYATIDYIDQAGNKYSLSDIASIVSEGGRIILLGEFGTGKSRCIKETFSALCDKPTLLPVLAINLRENWGMKTFDLIVRNHLNSLGLAKYGDNIVKLVRAGKVNLLLDGFDEVGSQSWSGEPERLKEIRRKSLEGTKDLLAKCSNSGFLIAGREHYFSSDIEMFDCLGLDHSVKLLRCPDEFSEIELKDYLSKNSSLEDVPVWMPRKPLLCQLIAKLEDEVLEQVINSSDGEVEFFESTFDAICARETRINSSIDRETLKNVLLFLSQFSRAKGERPEEITPAEINDAFFKVSGLTPLDEASIMLQRLPYLGRVGSGSANRTFIDEYAKSGLRGLSLGRAFSNFDKNVAAERWRQPLGIFGAQVLSTKIQIGREAEKYVKHCNSYGNSQVSADYLCAALINEDVKYDFNGLDIFNANFAQLNLQDVELSKLRISDCYIEDLILSNLTYKNVEFLNCIFLRTQGVTGKDKLPDCFSNDCEFDSFSSVDNPARISELKLKNSQKTLVAILKKLFFQPGRGRKEEALLRGGTQYWDNNAALQIMQYLLTNGIIIKSPGDHGTLFIPQRRYMKRIAGIVELMNNSNDDLWVLVS